MRGNRTVLLLATLWLVAGRMAGAGAAGEVAEDVLLQYALPGELEVSDLRDGPHCRIFYPEAMLEGADRYPVVVWGNGSGASPVTYRPLLRHWAGHGMVVAAAMTPTAGSGAEMRRCLRFLSAEHHDNADSIFHQRLDLEAVATAGHSQGGGGAIMSAIDPRVITTVAIQPAVTGESHDADRWSRQGGPVLLLSGGDDQTVDAEVHHRPFQEAANTPVFWATLAGANHYTPLSGAGEYRAVTTAWLRWRLAGDETAGRLFNPEGCLLCALDQWSVVSSLPAR